MYVWVDSFLGVEGRLGFRNSMSLANMAYQDALMREGGVPTLEMQVLEFCLMVLGQQHL